EETHALRWSAELYRLQGIALIGLNRLEESEIALEKALRVARQQQAKTHELRAATNLARLRGDQGRRIEARDLLAPVYGWFIRRVRHGRFEGSEGAPRRAGVGLDLSDRSDLAVAGALLRMAGIGAT